MSKLRALVEEVDAALQIHIAGRSVTRFNRTAFILADDAAELASKLYLLQRDAAWSDRTQDGRPRSFRSVTAEVKNHCAPARPIVARIEERRERRNDFFHSTNLLDLTLHNRSVDEALVDLLDYCGTLFGSAWANEVAGTPYMRLAEAIIRIDLKAYSHLAFRDRLDEVLKALPRYGPKTAARGSATVRFNSDQHLSLALRNGGPELLAKLNSVLST